MTYPPIPTDIECSEAKWRAALDMAAGIVTNKARLFAELQDIYTTGWHRENVILIARLLIKAGEVPEPVDKEEEAWERVNRSFVRDGFTIKAAVTAHFNVSLKEEV